MNNLKKLKKNLINLIITSIIPFLIWGPFFPDLIISVSALLFLYYVFKNKKFFYFLNIPLIGFFIFCVYCILISIFMSKDTMLSFESSLFYFRVGIFACFVWYLIDKDKSILTFFYYVLITCFLILVIDGYIQYFTGKNLVGYKIIDNRISSFFGDELVIGSYLSRLFPLLFALFLIKKKHKFEIYLIGLLFILVDILIYMSGERSSFFFLNLSTLFIIILIKEYQKFRLITFAIAICCIYFLSLNSSEFSDRMFKEPARNMGFINSSEIEDTKNRPSIIFSPNHDSLIRTSFNMFKDQPLFGHGPKMFRVICKNEKYATGINPCMTHPHNFYVQLLAETGIVGFLFLFSILLFLFFTTLKQLKSIIFN